MLVLEGWFVLDCVVVYVLIFCFTGDEVMQACAPALPCKALTNPMVCIMRRGRGQAKPTPMNPSDPSLDYRFHKRI